MPLPSYIDSLSVTDFNYADHSSLTRDIVSLNVGLLTMVILVTAIRLTVRVFMIKAAGLDDWLILAAAFFTVVLCTFSFLGVHFGLGIHIWVLSNPFSLPEFLHKSTRITECLYGAYLAYATAITLVKMSLIVSYLRIFPSRSFRRLVFSTGVLIICMWLCSIFSIMFQCVPVEAAWNWEEPRARCIDVLAFFYVSSSVNIATDIVIWFAPLPIFWGMNMVTRERVAICGLFGFGFFAVIASILRLTHLHGLHTEDITYNAVPSLNWSLAETSTAIICACIPVMRPLGKSLSKHITPRLPVSVRNKTFAPSPSFFSAFPSPKPTDAVELAGAGGGELRGFPRGKRKGMRAGEEESEWEGLNGGGEKRERGVDLAEFLREGEEGVDSTPSTPGRVFASIDEKV